jgi:hypothetical protein
MVIALTGKNKDRPVIQWMKKNYRLRDGQAPVGNHKVTATQ